MPCKIKKELGTFCCNSVKVLLAVGFVFLIRMPDIAKHRGVGGKVHHGCIIKAASESAHSCSKAGFFYNALHTQTYSSYHLTP